MPRSDISFFGPEMFSATKESLAKSSFLIDDLLRSQSRKTPNDQVSWALECDLKYLFVKVIVVMSFFKTFMSLKYLTIILQDLQFCKTSIYCTSDFNIVQNEFDFQVITSTFT